LRTWQYLKKVIYSLRTSKRFREVEKQRKTDERELWDFPRCFARAKNESMTLAPFFARSKTPKIPFLGLSLLPNPMETLQQAKLIISPVV